MAAPLEGIRVLDMAWQAPGMFCATMLGDLGADIIKIYDPQAGSRGGPMSLIYPDSPVFPGWRNCRNMGLNLKDGDGRGIFFDMVKSSDVVTEGFRPGVVKRLGVDYDTLKEINPRIVYCSLSGFGQTGPYRDLVGHDINHISIGGFLGTLRAPDGTPIIPRTVIADFAAGGMCAVVGILAALMGRERSGRGQFVDVSMTDAVVELMMTILLPALLGGVVSEKGQDTAIAEQPRHWYNVYRAKDGKYVSVGAIEPWFYANLCRLLGREDFAEHQYVEGEKREEIENYFRDIFLTRTRDEWVEYLRQEDTCVTPVYTPEETIADPHLAARGMIAEVDHPTMGRTKQIGSMIKLSESPFRVRHWSRRFGQHTDEILSEFGYDAERIAELRERGIVG